MVDIRDLEKATKETMSFSEYKKLLRAYLQESDASSGTGFANFLPDYEGILKECYHDGCNAAASAAMIQYGL